MSFFFSSSKFQEKYNQAPHEGGWGFKRPIQPDVAKNLVFL